MIFILYLHLSSAQVPEKSKQAGKRKSKQAESSAQEEMKASKKARQYLNEAQALVA